MADGGKVPSPGHHQSASASTLPEIELTTTPTPPLPTGSAPADDASKLSTRPGINPKIQGSSSTDNLSSNESTRASLKRSTSSSRLDKKRVCTSCGTSTTPMWRRGPEGPLCNACGVKYRVQLKRSNKKLRESGGGSSTTRRSAAAAADSDEEPTPDSDEIAEPKNADPPVASAHASSSSSRLPVSTTSSIPTEAEIVSRVSRLVAELDELRETTRQIDAKMDTAFAVIKQIAQHANVNMPIPMTLAVPSSSSSNHVPAATADNSTPPNQSL